MPQPVLGAQSNLGGLFLSFHSVGPGHEAQVTSELSHLPAFNSFLNFVFTAVRGFIMQDK